MKSLQLTIVKAGRCLHCGEKLIPIGEVSVENPNQHDKHLYVKRCIRCTRERGWGDGYVVGLGKGVEFGKNLGKKVRKSELWEVEGFLRDREWQAFLNQSKEIPYDGEFWEELFDILGLDILIPRKR